MISMFIFSELEEARAKVRFFPHPQVVILCIFQDFFIPRKDLQFIFLGKLDQMAFTHFKTVFAK